MNWRRAGILLSIVFLLAVGSVMAYQLGRRAGRGAMCYEVAVHVPDASGRTLASTFLIYPEARSDYTVWGTHCTISIGVPRDGRLIGGRWRFEPSSGKLWADSSEAEELFRAQGRWRPHGTL